MYCKGHDTSDDYHSPKENAFDWFVVTLSQYHDNSIQWVVYHGSFDIRHRLMEDLYTRSYAPIEKIYR